MSILGKVRKNSIEVTPGFYNDLRMLAGNRAAVMESEMRYSAYDERPGRTRAIKGLRFLASGKVMTGYGIDAAMMRIKRLPYTKLWIGTDYNGRLSFKGLAKPHLVALIQGKYSFPGEYETINLSGYKCAQFWRAEEYVVNVPIDGLERAVFDKITMYPLSVAEDPTSTLDVNGEPANHWFPHHYLNGSSIWTCWGSFLEPVKGFIQDADLPGLFSILYRYLQVVTYHDSYCFSAVNRWKSITVPEFKQEALVWP